MNTKFLSLVLLALTLVSSKTLHAQVFVDRYDQPPVEYDITTGVATGNPSYPANGSQQYLTTQDGTIYTLTGNSHPTISLDRPDHR